MSAQSTSDLTLVLFSSNPCGSDRGARDRFDRYAAASGLRIRLLTLDAVGGAWLSELPETDDMAVLWDLAAGMPPKEIEVLTRNWVPGECRVGVRFARGSEGRGLARWKKIWSKARGTMRRAFGRLSDPCPPCAATTCARLKSASSALTSAPPARWPLTVAETASVPAQKIVEVPVMWVS